MKVPPREKLRAFYREPFERMKGISGFDPEAVEFFMNVIRTGDLVRGAIDARLRPKGLTAPSLGVLLMLSASPEGLPMTELGRRFLVTKANVTGLVDTLQRRGLVERVSDPSDRRVSRVRLTGEGRAVFQKLAPWHLAYVAGLSKDIPLSDRRAAIRALERLRAAVLEGGA